MIKNNNRLAVLAAAITFAGLIPQPVAADTRTDLEQAKSRLGVLEARIEAQESRVSAVNGDLQQLVARVDVQQGEFARVRAELRDTEAELGAKRTELAALRARLAARARDVYMHGPTRPINVVLGARSLGELTTRIGFAARLVERDADTATQVERARAELDVRRTEQERLLREEASRLRVLKREHRSVEFAFAEQQRQLDALARDRREALALVEQLRHQLRAEELARAQRVAGKGMPISFGEWAEAFLRTLGVPVSRPNLVAVVAWQTAEYTMATWNPLATTYSMPGATVFNSHGVKNYQSMEQGIQASIATLRRPNHGYEAVLARLAAGADAMETGRAINASDWCRGCTNGNYVIGLIPAVEAYYERYASR